MFDSDTIFIGLFLLFVWWVAASFAVGLAADKRGYSRGGWFCMSFLLGPFLAALLLIAHPVKDVVEKAVAGDGLLGLQHDSSWSPAGKEAAK